MDSWDVVRQRVREKVSQEAFENWFARTRFLNDESGMIRVLAPDAVTKTWIEQEYATVLRDALEGLPYQGIVFETSLTPDAHNQDTLDFANRR